MEPCSLGFAQIGPQVGAHPVLAQASHRDRNGVTHGGSQLSREPLEFLVGGDIYADTRALHAIMLSELHVYDRSRVDAKRPGPKTRTIVWLTLDIVLEALLGRA